MQYAYSIFALLGGLGAFLIGVKLLSDNAEKLAGNKMKGWFDKAGKSRLAGVGIGTAFTMVVQSSSLTTVMVVGLVNAGVMSLAQAATIIMGANIGTTITAQIAALQSFSFAAFAMGLAGIGVLGAMILKKEKAISACYLIAGLGLVFIGLEIMADSMTVVRESEAVMSLFSSVTNPFFLFFIGIAVTAVVQSSSAVTSVIISMAAAGITIGDGGNSVFYIILGTNIGTCVTALISSIGASVNARRAAVIHLLFNVIGSLIFLILLVCWRSFADVTFSKWFSHESTQIAMFHTFFNVTCTLIFLPFSKVFVKLATILVPDKREKSKSAAPLIDKRLLSTPEIAVESASKELSETLQTAIKSLKTSVDGFIEKDAAAAENACAINSEVAKRAQLITEYLIKISSCDAGLDTEKRISALHSAVGDVERIAELSENITKYTKRAIKDNLKFSAAVKEELQRMLESVITLSQFAEAALEKKESLSIKDADDLENAIDAMRKTLIKDHIARLNKGECAAENSGVFINLVCNLERAGDHLTFIVRSAES